MSNFRIKASLFLNYFVFAILLNSVGTVILQVQRNYSIAKDAASVLEGFKDLSIAITSFLIASFVVRIGYKRSMLVGLGIVTVACGLMPVLPGFQMTKVLFACVGISFAMIKVSVFSTIGLITRDQKEHLGFMNFLESVFMVGVVVQLFLFAGFVDDHNALSTSWLNVYYILAGLSFIAFVLLFTTPVDESTVKGTSQASPDAAEEFAATLKLIVLPLVLVFIFCVFFYVLIEQSIMSWLPTFNTDVMNLTPSLAIIMASILAGSSAVGRFLAGILLKRFNWIAVLVICIICAGALTLVTIPMTRHLGQMTVKTLSDVPFVAFMFPLIGLFLAPIYPAINSIILSNLPKRKHSAMSGLIVVFSALGGTTGSIITGNIFEHYGGQTAFYFSLIPMSVLIGLLFVFKGLQKKYGMAETVDIEAGH